MDKNSIIIFVIFVLLVGGVVVLTKNSSLNAPASVNGAPSSLIASEKLYEFGQISMANGNVSHVFKISNPTTRDIKVEKLVTSCMCTTAYIIKKDGSRKGPFSMPGMGYVPPADEVVKAGETLEVEAVYNPNAHGPAGVGFIDRFIELTEASGSVLQLEIKAEVTP